MGMIPIAFLVIFILGAMVALGIGHKGWSYGTIAAAWLLLLASIGFIVLVAMVSNRERQWRKIARDYELAIAKERDAMAPNSSGVLETFGEEGTTVSKSLSELDLLRTQWQRIASKVNSWRGRHWEKAAFEPPRELNDGTITITDSEKPAIAPGAILYLFGIQETQAQGGTFLGEFIVQKANENIFDISPTSIPNDNEKKSWDEPYESITVYENLPFDRWLTYYRTKNLVSQKVPPEEGTLSPDRLKELEQHEESLDPVPAETPGEEEPENPLATVSLDPPLGVRWATVTFLEPCAYTWPDGNPASFAQDESFSAFPAEHIKHLRDSGASFKHQWNYPPGVRWAKVLFTAPKVIERTDAAAKENMEGGGEPFQFESGAEAFFDIETAEKLAQENVVEIKERIFRRPLVDPFTELRGNEKFGVEGILLLRKGIENLIGGTEATRDALKQANASAQEDILTRKEEREKLMSDKSGWSTDAQTATKIVEKFQSKVMDRDKNLASLLNEIQDWDSEFRTISQTLEIEVDRRSPSPSP